MLDARIAIVTGAGQGLGRAIVLEMARQGAAGVTVVDRDAETAAETAALARGLGAVGPGGACGLRDRGQIEAMVASTVERFGGIDVLVNSAGVIESTLTSDCAVDTLPEDVWDAVYEPTLPAPWLATNFSPPPLRPSRRGPNIVNAGSVSGLLGFANAPAYCTT